MTEGSEQQQRPQRSEGDRPPRRSDGDRPPRRDGDRPPRRYDRDNRDGQRRRRSNELRPLEVVVENNNVGRALSQLKREMARDGIRKELKRRRFYEKPSVKKRRKWRDAERRRRKERRRARMAQ